MSEVSDWILAIFTVVLSGATIALAWHTYRLVKVTKDVNEAAEASKIMPLVVFDTTQPLKDGAGQYLRFSVKNIGRGHARNLEAKARLKTGEELEIFAHSYGDVIETNNLYYWDIFGVKEEDAIEVEIAYTDLKGRAYPTLKRSFIAS